MLWYENYLPNLSTINPPIIGKKVFGIEYIVKNKLNKNSESPVGFDF